MRYLLSDADTSASDGRNLIDVVVSAIVERVIAQLPDLAAVIAARMRGR